MGVRIAINGFGRIGRIVMRAMHGRKNMEIVAINDLAKPEHLALLLKYDSVQKRFPGTVDFNDKEMIVDGVSIPIYAERDPAQLPWREMNVDIVIESTGIFRTPEKMKLHLDAGAKKVILSAPPQGKIDATIVLGVNDKILSPKFDLISNASCTTNCLAPLCLVLHEEFGIESGFMNTIHAYTGDQRLIDTYHQDPRRARSAAVNIVPTTTGAAKAVTEVIPQLKGKLDGFATRVPVSDGSLVDFTVNLKRNVTISEVNAAFKKWSQTPLQGILYYCTDPIVSSDIVGNAHSSIFDSLATMVNGNFVKVLSWYDNEWGYSTRMVDLAEKIAEMNGYL